VTDTVVVDEVNAAVAFADLAGFTALTEAHGDVLAADIAERLVSVTNSVTVVGDRLVKDIGDAVLLTSTDAASGISLVLRLFDACEADPEFPDLRAGVHYGSVVERGHDIFGSTVNIAARITAKASGGQILMTEPVADAAAASGQTVRALGALRLHNLSEPVELYKLVRTGVDDHDVDPVCRMRINPATAVGRLTYAGTDYLFCSLLCAGKFAAEPDRFSPLR
jgi:adenylate cyclase